MPSIAGPLTVASTFRRIATAVLGSGLFLPAVQFIKSTRNKIGANQAGFLAQWRDATETKTRLIRGAAAQIGAPVLMWIMYGYRGVSLNSRARKRAQIENPGIFRAPIFRLEVGQGSGP